MGRCVSLVFAWCLGRMGRMYLYYPTRGGVMPLALGWLLFYPFMGALCWLCTSSAFLYLKAFCPQSTGDLLGGECFIK